MTSQEDIRESLAKEILRKLELVNHPAVCQKPVSRVESGTFFNLSAVQATQAEQKEDREIVCSEVFADVTGKLDEVAQGRCLCSAALVQQYASMASLFRRPCRTPSRAPPVPLF